MANAQPSPGVLLLDIGNTHTHAGWANAGRITRQLDFKTSAWFESHQSLPALLKSEPQSIAICSVVPKATRKALRFFQERTLPKPFLLDASSLRGIGIDYPNKRSIGADRLANALAALNQFGAPVVVVDFGTAVTFDVVNGKGNYSGGVIAPGLAAMTEYLHEKTALLPKIRVREIRSVIGKSTEEAMLIGAVHGYRGLISRIISELKQELAAPRLPVVATGGYAKLMAHGLKEINSVNPLLTLQGLLLAQKNAD